MSWIKIQTTLPTAPEVLKLATLLNVSRREALGIAVEWFAWLDAQCLDEHTKINANDLDLVMDVQGLANALISVGWICADNETNELLVVDFDKHNSQSAKTRALTAKRVRKSKTGNAKVTHDALPREEKKRKKEKREKEKIPPPPTASAAQPAPPSAPHPLPAPPVQAPSPSAPPLAMPGINQPPPISGEIFGPWLAAIAAAHPSVAKSRTLSVPVLDAALAAYQRIPDAPKYAELLTAYFRSTQQKDHHGTPFWRPTGQEKYFDYLEDIIAHAERWAKENRWHSATVKPTPTPKPNPAKNLDLIDTPEKIAAALKELQLLRNNH